MTAPAPIATITCNQLDLAQSFESRNPPAAMKVICDSNGNQGWILNSEKVLRATLTCYSAPEIVAGAVDMEFDKGGINIEDLIFPLGVKRVQDYIKNNFKEKIWAVSADSFVLPANVVLYKASNAIDMTTKSKTKSKIQAKKASEFELDSESASESESSFDGPLERFERRRKTAAASHSNTQVNLQIQF